MNWKSSDGETEAAPLTGEMETLFKGMLNKQTLIDLICHFVVFEKTRNATYLGFTDTPIEKTDINTSAVFGNYIDIYDIAQAVEDVATVWRVPDQSVAQTRCGW